MKIGSKELLDKVQQPKQLELFPYQMTLIEKFYMDYVTHISEQINKNMQLHIDMMLLQPVHSKTLHPIEYGSSIKDMLSKSYRPIQGAAVFGELYNNRPVGMPDQNFWKHLDNEYAADPTV